MIEWTNKASVLAAMKQWPAIFADEARTALSVYAELIVAQVIERTPVGTGAGPWGHLSNSIMAGEPVSGIHGWEVEYGTPCHYAEVIEMGRRPGTMPPVEEIYEWVRLKPGFSGLSDKQKWSAAFAIAKAIQKRGFKDHPEGWQMFKKGLAAAEPQLDGVLRQMALNFERRTQIG